MNDIKIQRSYQQPTESHHTAISTDRYDDSHTNISTDGHIVSTSDLLLTYWL